MSPKPVKLTERQLDVLRWVGDGCPARDWPDEGHKVMARAMSYRGLVEVRRRHKVWTATITDAGRYYLDHGHPPPRPTPDPEPERELRPRLGRSRQTAEPKVNFPQQHAVPDEPRLDATARAMRRVAARPKPGRVARRTREIRKTYMRYKVVVTRVQVAERFVRATSEEDAAQKVQAEFDRPYAALEASTLAAQSSLVLRPRIGV